MLYTFTGAADGGGPEAGVILDSAGNLYGTTPNGGSAGAGLVYKLDTAGHETVLYNFTGGVDGANPIAGVIRDSNGNLYGTTQSGGAASFDYQGVVYKLDTTGHETVLYTFTGGSDGGQTQAGLILDSTGDLFGTATGGGSNPGAVFKVDAAGHATMLYTFTGGADGSHPYAGVVLDSAGNLYGTTAYGGPANGGVVFKLDTSGRETVLYGFPGAADGSYPSAGLIRDSAGNFYGTTSAGGTSGWGTVYKLDATGHETVLYTFTGGADGGGPNSGVIRDSSGNLYGTAVYGGTADYGVVYKVDTSGQETVLYSFTGGADGSNPLSGVIRDSAGNLYGTNSWRGSGSAGVVYVLRTTGRLTVLYTFTGGADGNRPYAGVIRDAGGNLYGTTFFGGAQNAGVVYKVDTAGQQTVLHAFGGGGNDGGNAFAGVIIDSAGNLYGTNSNGGSGGQGVVYELDATGNYTVLYSFGGANGGDAHAGVILSSSGSLFGATQMGGKRNVGVVFRLTPQ